MPTFECLNRGNHEISAKKTEQGIDVTFDGVTKTVVESRPSAELLGNTDYFASHEYCIYRARKSVNQMLADAMR